LPLQRQRQGAAALLDDARQSLPIRGELARKFEAGGVEAYHHVVSRHVDVGDGKAEGGLIGAVCRARPAAIVCALDVENEAQGSRGGLERAEPGAREIDVHDRQRRVWRAGICCYQ
jgi:hypothetical protein